MLKEPVGFEQKSVTTNAQFSTPQQLEPITELDAAKTELSNLKVRLLSIMEEKAALQEEAKVAFSKVESGLDSIKQLETEIEETNEEHVLVELARIEASKECKEINEQRNVETKSFYRKMEETKARISDMTNEIRLTDELKRKLDITTSDLSFLQSEMVFVRAMGKNVDNKSKKTGKEVKEIRVLKAAEDELDAAKKELAKIKEEGFCLMASMDVAREELASVLNEALHLRKLEEKIDVTVQKLNSKLLMAKSKLETASRAEQKAKSIVANLSAAMTRLESDAEEAKKEEENAVIQSNSLELVVQKNNQSFDEMKEKLLEAMRELEAAKESEMLALQRLKSVSTQTMSSKASLVRRGSKITISRFEYEYLNKRAEGARELADVKVAAAEAWVESLRASEKENLLRAEILQGEIQEITELEEKELNQLDKAMTIVTKARSKSKLPGTSFEESGAPLFSKRPTANRRSLLIEKGVAVEKSENSDTFPLEEKPEAANAKFNATRQRKSFKENGIPLSRKSKVRGRSSFSGVQIPGRSPTIVLRKKRKVMPNLVKFLRVKRDAKQNLVID